jgi:hypothetical protein
MFIQVIQGKVADAAGLHAAMDRWVEELQPGATGFLGYTAGITDDGTFIATVRFESAEAARRNSERPDQRAWWAETAKCFDGQATFLDCPQVMQWLQGRADDAGFVQVMEGRTPDANRLRQLMRRYRKEIRELLPEILGATVALRGDGAYVETLYFTSEPTAHQHIEPPADLADLIREEQELMGDVSYLDLHQPWLVSAGH